MGLFKPDLYRSFAIGFALGGLALLAAVGLDGHEPKGGMISSAQAAPAVVDQTR